MRDENWQAMRTLGPEAIEGYRPSTVIVAEVGLRKMAGNDRPYFAATGEIGTPGQLRNGNGEAYGMLHDELLRLFPEAAPIVALHLADDRGEPMHSVDNALHWMGFTGREEPVFDQCPTCGRGGHKVGTVWKPWEEWNDKSAGILARHLRVSENEARQIRAQVEADNNPREALNFIVKVDLRARWAAEARQALELLRSWGVEIPAGVGPA